MYKEELKKVLSFLLQVNPMNRPTCDMLLGNPIIGKRIDYNKSGVYGAQAQLLGTIKLPRNMSDINQKLPKTKKYVE
jgi:NIMA (never in mitosis gene a)-related kinase